MPPPLDSIPAFHAFSDAPDKSPFDKHSSKKRLPTAFVLGAVNRRGNSFWLSGSIVAASGVSSYRRFYLHLRAFSTWTPLSRYAPWLHTILLVPRVFKNVGIVIRAFASLEFLGRAQSKQVACPQVPSPLSGELLACPMAVVDTFFLGGRASGIGTLRNHRKFDFLQYRYPSGEQFMFMWTAPFALDATASLPMAISHCFPIAILAHAPIRRLQRPHDRRVGPHRNS